LSDTVKPSTKPTPRTATRRRLTYFGVALVAMGMLLWARLILVTGRPRTAIADPEAKQKQAQREQKSAPASGNAEDAGKPPWQR
jgi:hypothetical protein